MVKDHDRNRDTEKKIRTMKRSRILLQGLRDVSLRGWGLASTAVQHGTWLPCSIAQYSMVPGYSTVKYSTVQWFIIPGYSAVQYSAEQHGTWLQCSTVQCSAAWYLGTVQ